MDYHDINGAKAVVLHLCRSGLSWYRSGRPPKAWEIIYNAIGEDYRIYLNEEEVEGTLLQGQEVGGVVEGEMVKRYILLAPPGGRPVVCLLGSRWRLAKRSVELSLYLHLFGQSQQKCVPLWHRGYRLELPHKQGIHDYTHVQPVRVAGWQERIPVPFAEQNVPDTFPAFPLKGRSLTTLCAALAIALDVKDFPNLIRALHGLKKQREVREFFS